MDAFRLFIVFALFGFRNRGAYNPDFHVSIFVIFTNKLTKVKY